MQPRFHILLCLLFASLSTAFAESPGNYQQLYEAGKDMREQSAARAQQYEAIAQILEAGGQPEAAIALWQKAAQEREQEKEGEKLEKQGLALLQKVNTTYGKPTLSSERDISGVDYTTDYAPEKTVVCVGPHCHNGFNDSAAEHFKDQGYTVLRNDGTPEGVAQNLRDGKAMVPDAETAFIVNHGAAENGGSIGTMNVHNLKPVAEALHDGGYTHCVGVSCNAGAGSALGPALAQESGAEVSLSTGLVRYHAADMGITGDPGALLKTWSPGVADLSQPLSTPTLTQYQQMVEPSISLVNQGTGYDYSMPAPVLMPTIDYSNPPYRERPTAQKNMEPINPPSVEPVRAPELTQSDLKAIYDRYQEYTRVEELGERSKEDSDLMDFLKITKEMTNPKAAVKKTSTHTTVASIKTSTLQKTRVKEAKSPSLGSAMAPTTSQLGTR